MEIIAVLVNKIVPIFSIIGAGFLYGKIRTLETKSITELLLVVVMPCFALTATRKISLASSNVLVSALAPVVVSCGVLLSVFLFLRLGHYRKVRGLYLPAMFSNAGNIALPIALVVYGDEAVASTLVYMVVLGLLIYTLGIFIVSREIGVGQLSKQFVLYAMVLGFFSNIFHIPVPNQISSALEMMGAIAIPLLLFTLGYNLNKLRVNSLRLALMGSFFRIGIGFFLSWIIFIKLLGLTSITGKTIVLLSSMPSAVMVFPIAEKYDANPDIVASVIVMSTLWSIVTIPLVIWFLG